MNKRKIIVALISLGFISFLVVLLLKSRAEKTLPVIPIIPSPLPTETPWQIYSNQDYSYTISYPDDWQVEDWDIREAAKLKTVPDGSIWHQAKFKGREGSFEVLVWENKTKAPLKTWLSWFRHEDLDLEKIPEKENTEVGGIPAILYSQEKTARRKPLDYIFFKVDDKIFEFVEEKSDVLTERAAYDKIVSSFNFLEDEVPVEPKAETLVSQAKDDLSQKLGVKSEEIRLTKIEPVDWPDTSLGCPQQGMFYAQVITPGYKITLEGRGKSYPYHSDYRRVISCQK